MGLGFWPQNFQGVSDINSAEFPGVKAGFDNWCVYAPYVCIPNFIGIDMNLYI